MTDATREKALALTHRLFNAVADGEVAVMRAGRIARIDWYLDTVRLRALEAG